MNNEWFGRPGSRRRIAAFGLCVAAAGGVSGGIATLSLAELHVAPTDVPAATASATVPEVQQSDEPSAEASAMPDDAPSAAATITADEAASQTGVNHVFVENSIEGQNGYYMDGAGNCSAAYGKSPSEMVADMEARLGSRTSGYDWFKDGMIVKFRNGERIPVWSREIDCKDPPYDPLATGKK